VEVREAGVRESSGVVSGASGVAGVGVKVTTLNPQHVFRVSDYMRWIAGGPEEDEPVALTGADGTLVVRAPTDRPFMLNLMLPGAIPESLAFREIGVDGGGFAATGWIGVPVGVDPAAYYVQVTPESDEKARASP
jgi:hypothetical protein